MNELTRARDLGIPFDGTPGPLNAITDIAGVEVGHATLISGEGPLVVGAGPVRTGVTAILPLGKAVTGQVFAGWFALNGNGEMTGTTWVEESGFLDGPIMLTNTHSVGVVRDAVIAWRISHGHLSQPFALPVVGETWDGYLSDANGFHVRERHVFEAIDSAAPGPVAEGSVGGGTGMRCFDFKSGIGTASRMVEDRLGRFIVGALVQANFGRRQQLRIAGVPVGLEITEGVRSREGPEPSEMGSIIIVIATDAPLLPQQLKRMARRASLGVARTGGTAENGSGDIFIAFSVANRGADHPDEIVSLAMLPNDRMSSLFDATVEASEEAIINALVAARTLSGAGGRRALGLPHDQLQEVMRKYNRLAGTKERV